MAIRASIALRERLGRSAAGEQQGVGGGDGVFGGAVSRQASPLTSETAASPEAHQRGASGSQQHAHAAGARSVQRGAEIAPAQIIPAMMACRRAPARGEAMGVEVVSQSPAPVARCGAWQTASSGMSSSRGKGGRK